MKITVRELFKLGLWERFCDETGTNVWAVNEGLIDRDTEVEWELKTEVQDGKGESRE